MSRWYKKSEPINSSNLMIPDVAGSLDRSWNQVLPDLILFSERLEALGFRVINGEVTVADGHNA